MKSPLQKITLSRLICEPILFDANIFMVGLEERGRNDDYSFENMKQLYLIPIFESFQNLLIHDTVYNELDDEARKFVDLYIGKTVTIVTEGELYGKDPQYTTIFNNIASHELVCYERGKSKDKGEVYSMAYAAYHGTNYFCSREIMVDIVIQELEDLKDVGIITFDVIVLLAYCYYAMRDDNSKNKGLKAIYKRYCADVIKRNGLPDTLGEYVKATKEYL